MWIQTSKTGEMLSLVTYAYNTGVRSSTGFSPYELLFGYPPRVPLDNLLIPPSRDLVSTPEMVQKLAERLRKVRKIAQKFSDKRTMKSKERYDAKSRLLVFRDGDLVLRRIERSESGLSKKLSPFWDGPHRVVYAPIQASTVILRLFDDTDGKYDKVSVHHLKPYVERINTATVLCGNPLCLTAFQPSSSNSALTGSLEQLSITTSTVADSPNIPPTTESIVPVNMENLVAAVLSVLSKKSNYANRKGPGRGRRPKRTRALALTGAPTPDEPTAHPPTTNDLPMDTIPSAQATDPPLNSQVQSSVIPPARHVAPSTHYVPLPMASRNFFPSPPPMNYIPPPVYRKYPPRICYRCRRPGHIATDCTATFPSTSQKNARLWQNHQKIPKGKNRCNPKDLAPHTKDDDDNLGDDSYKYANTRQHSVTHIPRLTQRITEKYC